MTAAAFWDFHTALFQLVAGAMGDVPGYSSPNHTAPTRHWRLDGATFAPVDAFKNHGQGLHGATIHVFDADTDSDKWVKLRMADIAVAVDKTRLGDNPHAFRLESASVAFDPQEDSSREAHGVLRFSIIIGE